MLWTRSNRLSIDWEVIASREKIALFLMASLRSKKIVLSDKPNSLSRRTVRIYCSSSDRVGCRSTNRKSVKNALNESVSRPEAEARSNRSFLASPRLRFSITSRLNVPSGFTRSKRALSKPLFEHKHTVSLRSGNRCFKNCQLVANFLMLTGLSGLRKSTIS